VVTKWLLGGLGLILWCFPALAQRDELTVDVACENWPAEAVSRVEARIRATFLAESLSARRVHIRCGSRETASISVGGGPARPVARRRQRLEDDVVAAVELALRELEAVASPRVAQDVPPTASPTSPEPPTVAFDSVPATAAAPVEPSPTPVTPPIRVARDTQRQAPSSSRSSRSSVAFELGVTPLVERWGDHWALGAEGGMSAGDQFQYGLSVGGAAATGEPDTFEVSELRGNLRLAWTFAGASDLRVTLAAGASLLMTAPHSNVIAISNRPLGAASLGIHLSRAVWFGPFGVAPTLGARFFSGHRNVRVDDREELAVPVVSPQGGLWLIYRPSDARARQAE
jgi:hypothetical protein